MSKTSEVPLLTQFEAEVMSVLWRQGECTVRDVLNNLPRERQVAYTSVATMLKILEDKQFVSSVKAGKIHSFVPRLQKETFQRKTLRHIVDQFFDGDHEEFLKIFNAEF
jgi:predicted transcriptional regulator